MFIEGQKKKRLYRHNFNLGSHLSGIFIPWQLYLREKHCRRRRRRRIRTNMEMVRKKKIPVYKSGFIWLQNK